MGEQHYKRVSKKNPVYLYFLRGFFIMKFVKNSLQNARNCTNLKKFLGGACPQTPLATARSFATRGMYTQNHKKIKLPPPLRNPAYAPDTIKYAVYIVR